MGQRRVQSSHSATAPGLQLICRTETPVSISLSQHFVDRQPTNKSFGACFKTNPSSHFPSMGAGLFDRQCWSRNRETWTQMQLCNTSFCLLEVTSTTCGWKVLDSIPREICSKASCTSSDVLPGLASTFHNHAFMECVGWRSPDLFLQILQGQFFNLLHSKSASALTENTTIRRERSLHSHSQK